MLGRTLSTPNRQDDDATAKENFLVAKRLEIANMQNSGQITVDQAQTVYTAINHYVQFSGGQTRGGFERGLTELIATQLNNDLNQAMSSLSLQPQQ